jgi:hypothetical protein
MCNLFHKNWLVSHQSYIDQNKVGLNKPYRFEFRERGAWDISEANLAKSWN